MKGFVLAALLVVGCGASSLDTRLQTATIGVTYAELAESAFDKQHEIDIANTCTSTPDCVAKLASYRAERAKFDKAFAAVLVAFKAVMTAKNNQTVAGFEAAAVLVAAELAALGVK